MELSDVLLPILSAKNSTILHRSPASVIWRWPRRFSRSRISRTMTVEYMPSRSVMALSCSKPTSAICGMPPKRIYAAKRSRSSTTSSEVSVAAVLAGWILMARFLMTWVLIARHFVCPSGVLYSSSLYPWKSRNSLNDSGYILISTYRPDKYVAYSDDSR